MEMVQEVTDVSSASQPAGASALAVVLIVFTRQRG